MPERTFSSPEYRYGFNGKEKDESGEWGDLTHYDYGFRIYNPGVGRFLSVDPLSPQYPELTPYQFASNTPVWAIDLDGLEALTIDRLIGNFDVLKFKIITEEQVIKGNHSVNVHYASFSDTPNSINSLNGKNRMISIATPNNYDPTQTTIAEHLLKTSKLTITSTMKTRTGDVSIRTSFMTSGLGRIKMLGGSNWWDGRELSKKFTYKGEGLRFLFGRKIRFSSPNLENLEDAFQHITWQALTTIVFGVDFAQELGDAHERDKHGAWAMRYSFKTGGELQRLLRVTITDLVNNEYGRMLGVDLSSEYSLERLSTPAGMADFLNEIIENLRGQFPELKGSGPMFLESDQEVKEAAEVVEGQL